MTHDGLQCVLPVMKAQAGVLFDSESTAGRGAYVQQYVRWFSGAVDIGILQAAWAAALKRHPALRAAFVARLDGELVQAILAEVRMPWQDAGEVELEWFADWLVQDRRTTFDLARAPLMRACVAKVGDSSTLIWTVHHALLDGWSAEFVLDEVFEDYQRLLGGGNLAQHEDYDLEDFCRVVKAAALEDSVAAVAYWREALPSELPGAHVRRLRTDNPYERTAELNLTLAAPAWSAFQQLCQKNRVSLVAGLQCAWAVTLARFSGRKQVSFGLTVAGRETGVVESRIVGMFVTTIPVFVELKEELAFSEAARAIATQIASAARYPTFGLSDIKRAANISPAMEMFDTALVFAGRAHGDREGHGARDQASERFYGQTRFGLTVTFHLGETMELRITWNEGEIAPETSNAVGSEFLAALSAFANDDRQTIAGVCRHLGERTEGPMHAPVGLDELPTSIASRFAEICRTHPERCAMSWPGGRLTYTALSAEVSARRSWLVAVGIRAGDIIAIASRSRRDSVVLMLAINSARATYLPVDPKEPPDRALEILIDAGEPLLLCDQASRANFLRYTKLIMIADLPGVGEAQPEPPADRKREPFYMMYTSGSSGAPKSVTVPEQAVLRLVCQPNFVALAPESIVAQASSLAFDASTFEIYAALLNGAELAFLDETRCVELGGLGEEIRQRGVTIAFVTTALLNETASSDAGTFEAVEDVLFGGERVNPEMVRKLLLSGRGPRRLIHVYGPTEGTVFSLFHRVFEAPAVGEDVPLGTPVSGTAARVVAAFGDDTPRGGVGELVVGGVGLAIGYTSGEATREKFFYSGADEGEALRWYRTGDLVHRSEKGDIFFLDRIDAQVKIRGYRVELGEVASRIERLAYVSACAVDYDHKCLALRAAIILSDRAITRSQLRADLKEILPAYMVPGELLLAERIPLTRNGKVDRTALAKLWASARATEEAPSARDDIEASVAEVWETLLGRRIGPDESFFDAGANSLLMIRAVNLLRHATGLKIRVADLFEFVNLRELAAFVNREATKTRKNGDTDLTPLGRKEG